MATVSTLYKRAVVCTIQSTLEQNGDNLQSEIQLSGGYKIERTFEIVE